MQSPAGPCGRLLTRISNAPWGSVRKLDGKFCAKRNFCGGGGVVLSAVEDLEVQLYRLR